MGIVDTAYAEEAPLSPPHHHEWGAGPDDDRWRCSRPGCGAWISRLATRDGRTIPLPKDRPHVLEVCS